MIEVIREQNLKQTLEKLKAEIAKSNGTMHLAVHPFYKQKPSKEMLDCLAGEKTSNRKAPLVVFEQNWHVNTTVNKLNSLIPKREIYVVPTNTANPLPLKQVGGWEILNNLGIKKIFLAGQILAYATDRELEELTKWGNITAQQKQGILDLHQKEIAELKKKHPNFKKGHIESLAQNKVGCVGIAYMQLRKANFEVVLMPSFCHSIIGPFKRLKE